MSEMHSEPESTVVEPLAAPLLTRAYGELVAVLQALMLIMFFVIAIAAIAEISSRQAFVAMTAERVGDLQSDIVDLTARAPSDPDAARRVASARDYLSEAKQLARDAQSLLVVGAFDRTQTLRTLQARHGGYDVTDRTDLFSARSRLAYLVTITGFDFETVGADHLLATALICCGAIGAFIAAIRTDASLRLRFLSIGMAAGFIVFLGIKGGRHIFLIQTGVDVMPFNPYSSAFAGLLAGLFTERAYRLLSAIVERLADRIEKAVATA